MFHHLKTKLESHRHAPAPAPSINQPQPSSPAYPAPPRSPSQLPLSQRYRTEQYVHPATAFNDAFDRLSAGIDLARRTFTTFYSSTHHAFCNPHHEPGTVDAQHGYVVWPVSIIFWALADVYRATRDPHDKDKLYAAFAAMEAHWSDEWTGYCAWHFFPGNNDVYFDDNAHCGNALVSAFEATGDRLFLNRAEQIVTGIINRGWDRGGSSQGAGPGGVRWHVDPAKSANSRNACSTLSVAVLACRLALLDVQRAYCTELAASCITFSEAHLVASDDGLVIDNLSVRTQRDELGVESLSWVEEKTKWTYNTGFAIHAYTLWAQVSGDQRWLEKALEMALVAVDPAGGLFDRSVEDEGRRVWWDTTFFAHHLIDALVFLVQTISHIASTKPSALPFSPPAMTSAMRRIAGMLHHISSYMHLHLLDPHDGLYFRNLRLYRIGEEQRRRHEEVFGTSHELDADSEEREEGQGAVQERRLIKTLLGNAGAARCYLRCAEVEGSIKRFEEATRR